MTRVARPTTYTYIAHDLEFEIGENDQYGHRYAYVHPQNPGYECMIFSFSPKRTSKEDESIIIQTVNYNNKCTKPGTKELHPRDGTRKMIIGALQAMIQVAKKKYPHLKEFVLADQAVYTCNSLMIRYA